MLANEDLLTKTRVCIGSCYTGTKKFLMLRASLNKNIVKPSYILSITKTTKFGSPFQLKSKRSLSSRLDRMNFRFKFCWLYRIILYCTLRSIKWFPYIEINWSFLANKAPFLGSKLSRNHLDSLVLPFCKKIGLKCPNFNWIFKKRPFIVLWTSMTLAWNSICLIWKYNNRFTCKTKHYIQWRFAQLIYPT